MVLNAFFATLKRRTPDPPPEPEGLPELTIGSGYVLFTSEESWYRKGTVELLFTPSMLYKNGKTYFPYQSRVTVSPHGQIRMLVFDENQGFDRPVTVGDLMPLHPTGVGDTHVQPAFGFFPDPTDSDIEKIYITQERTHLSPFYVYKGINGDYSRFTTAFQIGVNLAYTNILTKVDGHPIIVCRGGDTASGDANHTYAICVVDSTNYFEGLDTATPRQITQKEGQGLWHYPYLPFGHQRWGNKFFILISRRTGQADGGTTPTPITNESTHKFYLVVTEDFINFENYQSAHGLPGAFTHDTGGGLLTGTILQTNYQYHATNATAIQGRVQCAGMSSEGRFYAICGTPDGDGTYLFIYYDHITGGVIKKPISIPDMWEWDLDLPTNSFYHLMVMSESDIRCIMYKNIGGFRKVVLIKTVDKGDSWVELGDMIPEITDQDMVVDLPNNVMTIPRDKNFPAFFSYVVDGPTDNRVVIGKLAAWGDIQPMSGESVTAASDMNYLTFNRRHYKCVDASITRSGNNVTALTDLFGNGNATGVNNPQWNGSDTITMLAGSSRHFIIGSSTDVVNADVFTILAVVKMVPATAAVIFNCSVNSASNQYVELLVGADGYVYYRCTDTNTGTFYGSDNIDDGEFHVIGMSVDGRAGGPVHLYVDGRLQYVRTTMTNDQAGWGVVGQGPNGVGTSGANVARIASRDLSTTDVYYSFDFKEMVMWNAVLPWTTLRSKMKKLCDDHSITFLNQYQIPS